MQPSFLPDTTHEQRIHDKHGFFMSPPFFPTILDKLTFLVAMKFIQPTSPSTSNSYVLLFCLQRWHMALDFVAWWLSTSHGLVDVLFVLCSIAVIWGEESIWRPFFAIPAPLGKSIHTQLCYWIEVQCGLPRKVYSNHQLRLVIYTQVQVHGNSQVAKARK